MNLHPHLQKVFKMGKKTCKCKHKHGDSCCECSSGLCDNLACNKCKDRRQPDSSPSSAESESALNITMLHDDSPDSPDISDILSKSDQNFINAETSVSSVDMTSLLSTSKDGATPAAGVSGVGQGELFNEK